MWDVSNNIILYQIKHRFLWKRIRETVVISAVESLTSHEILKIRRFLWIKSVKILKFVVLHCRILIIIRSVFSNVEIILSGTKETYFIHLFYHCLLLLNSFDWERNDHGLFMTYSKIKSKSFRYLFFFVPLLFGWLNFYLLVFLYKKKTIFVICILSSVNGDIHFVRFLLFLPVPWIMFTIIWYYDSE